jgi:Leucine-rich repeat (LRR) protein
MTEPTSIVSGEHSDQASNLRTASRVLTAILGIVLAAAVFVVFTMVFELVGLPPENAPWLSLITTLILIAAVGVVALVRRRFRFSLGLFLLFNVICGAALAFLAGPFQALRRETIAIRELQNARATILFAPSAAPDWLQRLVGKEYFGHGSAIGVKLDESASAGLLSNVTVSHLRGLPQLLNLDVTGPGISGADLEVLGHLRNLEVLRLDRVRLTDDDLKRLSGLSRLKELRLDSTRISDVGVTNITGMSQLEALALDGAGITDASVEGLAALGNLRSLSLNSTLVSDEGIARLRESLPRASITNEHTTPRQQLAAIEMIRGFGGIVQVGQQQDGKKKATTIDFAVSIGNKVTDAELATLSNLPDIEVLELGNNPGITDAGLAHLSGLANLKTLYLYGTSVRGPGIGVVATLPKLEALSLQGTPVTDRGILQLKNSKSLKWLQLNNTGVSDAAIQSLKFALPELEIVR